MFSSHRFYQCRPFAQAAPYQRHTISATPEHKLKLVAHLTKGTFANDLNRPEVFQTHTGPPQAQKGRLFLAELGEHAFLSLLGHGNVLVELAFQFNAPEVNANKHIIQYLRAPRTYRTFPSTAVSTATL